MQEMTVGSGRHARGDRAVLGVDPVFGIMTLLAGILTVAWPDARSWSSRSCSGSSSSWPGSSGW